MKHCTVVLGSLGRNMLHSVHSMQKYCTIILIGCIWCQSGLVHTVGNQLLCLCTATSNSRRANCPLPRHVTCTRNLRFSQRCDRHCVARYVVSGVSTASKRSETSLLTTLYILPPPSGCYTSLPAPHPPVT